MQTSGVHQFSGLRFGLSHSPTWWKLHRWLWQTDFWKKNPFNMWKKRVFSERTGWINFVYCWVFVLPKKSWLSVEHDHFFNGDFSLALHLPGTGMWIPLSSRTADLRANPPWRLHHNGAMRRSSTMRSGDFLDAFPKTSKRGNENQSWFIWSQCHKIGMIQWFTVYHGCGHSVRIQWFITVHMMSHFL